MTQYREFNAATVDDALEKASSSLGVPTSELSYEVLDEGSVGFLGIGARDARITVALPEGIEGLGAETSLAAENAAEDEDLGEVAAGPSDELSEVFAETSEAEHAAVPEELLEEVKDLVTSMVGAMGFESRIDVYDAGSFVAADVASDNTALFIGQKGETIDALQHLINAAVYRRRPFVKRIVLDAEGYRQRRIEAIQGMAHRTARRAVRERRTVELPPMNPSERRIVHLFLRDNPKVTTASEGSGDNRRVRISPT
ncbi:MAG: protein jag [Actinomycetota bacterium]|jgi:spoIIIJ-associated protein|nr:protein jag [Actinomycetota bacterium]